MPLSRKSALQFLTEEELKPNDFLGLFLSVFFLAFCCIKSCPSDSGNKDHTNEVDMTTPVLRKHRKTPLIERLETARSFHRGNEGFLILFLLGQSLFE